MKITNNLDGKSMYLQVRDIKYLKNTFNFNFPDEREILKEDDNNFIFIDDKKLTEKVKEKDEILEVSTFLKMNFKEIEQYLDDAEQVYAISKRIRASYSELQRSKYAYKSAVFALLEKTRNTLSFDLPIAIDMLDENLYYGNNGEYYASSTSLTDTYMIGRTDNNAIDNADYNLPKFINRELANILVYNQTELGENVSLVKTKGNGEKRLYYTIRRK